MIIIFRWRRFEIKKESTKGRKNQISLGMNQLQMIIILLHSFYEGFAND